MKSCCEETPSAGKATTALPSGSRTLRVALAGNPNSGKSSVFNALTGIHQYTGNWPGVTVERREGQLTLDDAVITLIDLPGIYSLDVHSPDEQVARDYLLSRDYDVIVNVLDASNLERHLALTVQLLEMGLPLVVALNMSDVAEQHGIQIDGKLLANQLGCPVVRMVAVTHRGITGLTAQILKVTDSQRSPGYPLTHGPLIQESLARLLPMLENGDTRNAHWLGLKLLEGDPVLLAAAPATLKQQIEEETHQIERMSGQSVDQLITNSRFGHAHTLANLVSTQPTRTGPALSDQVDRWLLHPVFGVFFFLFAMYLTFSFTIHVGGAFVDFFKDLAGALWVDGPKAWLAPLGLPSGLILLIANGLGGGLQVVATFVPIIASLYLVLSILEDSGYMARAAFVMDRFLRSVGLPGKAFVPLIVGFGCNVPGVSACRTLETEEERRLTILLLPFMSCGARLQVYTLFVTAFFATQGTLVVFSLYLLGIAAAVLSVLLLGKSLINSEHMGFLMELPAYHRPTVRSVLLRTWDRVRGFVVRAGGMIVVMVVVINLLSGISSDGQATPKGSDRSILSRVSQVITPVFYPMGMTDDNWPAVVGIFTGVLAKEAVVGTLSALYTGGEPETEAVFSLKGAVMAAVATIPKNLRALVGATAGEGEDEASKPALLAALGERFHSPLAAYAYLVFVLLYFPCAATVSAIIRETGWRWAAVTSGWGLVLGYAVATLFYQVPQLSSQPLGAAMWIGLCLGSLVLTVGFLRRIALTISRPCHPGMGQPVTLITTSACPTCGGCGRGSPFA
ncbi:Fe(2+) transporter FeoB [Gammaproteobacteria bacterium]